MDLVASMYNDAKLWSIYNLTLSIVALYFKPFDHHSRIIGFIISLWQDLPPWPIMGQKIVNSSSPAPVLWFWWLTWSFSRQPIPRLTRGHGRLAQEAEVKTRKIKLLVARVKRLRKTRWTLTLHEHWTLSSLDHVSPNRIF